MDTSHGNDESNIRFARSLNGEMKRFSPRRTLAHMSSVAAAGVPRKLLSRTRRRSRRIHVPLNTSRPSLSTTMERALIYSRNASGQ